MKTEYITNEPTTVYYLYNRRTNNADTGLPSMNIAVYKQSVEGVNDFLALKDGLLKDPSFVRFMADYRTEELYSFVKGIKNT